MSKNQLSINPNRCRHCLLCVRECPLKVLEMHDGVVRYAENGEDRCFRCQHCMAICPYGAISIFGVDQDKCSDAACGVEGTDLIRLMKGRRTCRNYRNENVEHELIDELVRVLKWAPTGVNDHHLRFTVIGDVVEMDKIRDYINSKLIKIMAESPESYAAKAFGRYRYWIEQGRDVLFRGAPHMLIVSSPKNAPCAAVDPVIALSYFELLAAAHGLGTTWCGLAKMGFLLVAPELLKKINIPDDYEFGYAMLFGNPRWNFVRGTMPEEEVVDYVHDLDL